MFPLKAKAKQVYLLPPPVQVLARALSEGDQGDTNRKGRSQNILSEDDNTLNIKDPNDTRNLLRLINTIYGEAGHKSNTQ